MASNPLSATREIQESYVNFFKANFTLGNTRLSEKLERLKENNRLWKSPYIFITQNYLTGQKYFELMTDTGIDEDVLLSVGIDKFFKHQELAIKNIVKHEKHTIISSGTGSGKTESFLIPVLDACAKSDVKGVKAIIVYPMNALAGDQVTRLRNYLYKLNKKRDKKGLRKITFGIYNGPTPSTTYVGNQLNPSLVNLEYQCPDCLKNSLGCKKSDSQSRCILYCKRNPEIKIDFQLLSREDIRENPPDILVTSYVMLDRILLRPSDNLLFQNNKVKYLVLDEMHTYAGARGVDVALLLRRLKRRLENDALEKLKLLCIGTSATMSKAKDIIQRKEAVAEFAQKLFGESFSTDDIFEGERKKWDLPPTSTIEKYEVLDVNDDIESNFADECFSQLCEKVSRNNSQIENSDKKKFLGQILLKNEFFQFLIQNLDEPRSIDEIKELLKQNQSISVKIENIEEFTHLEELIWSYLKAGSIAKNPSQSLDEPLIRTSIHNSFRGLPQIFMCTNPSCGKMFFVNKDQCDECKKKVEELGVCRNCSREFFITKVSQDDLEHQLVTPDRNRILHTSKGEVQERPNPIKRFSYDESDVSVEELWYSVLNEDEINDENDDEDVNHHIGRYNKCLDCGSFSPSISQSCINHVHEKICNSNNLIQIETYPPKPNATPSWRPRDCPFCHFSYGSGYAVTQFQMAEKQASVNLFNMIYDHIENQKLLIFTDSRQAASDLSWWLDFAHEDTALKQFMIQKLYQIESSENEPIRFDRFQDNIIDSIEDDWYSFNFEGFDHSKEEYERKILLEVSSKLRLSLERLGLIQYDYRGLVSWEKFKPLWISSLSSVLPNRNTSLRIQNILNLQSPLSQDLNKFIITILNMMRTEAAIEGLENRRGESKTYAHGFEFDNDGNSKPVDYGVKIHNIVNNRSKFIKYTQKVFQLESEDDKNFLLETIWNFMEKNGYIIRRGLKKYSREPIMAHVVSTGKLLVSVPKKIQKCPQCKSLYMNLPNNTCRNYVRQRICPSTTIEMTYEELCKESNESHFFKLFKEKNPKRMSVREHTAAIDEAEKNLIQNQFGPYSPNDRKIDVIVATPTLELGVDIGDLSSVGLYKSPPSPTNYLQRVGRAGRRSGIAFINTFFFNSPIDEFYYRNPQDLIKGNFNPPPIKIENNDLLDRHLNSLILEHLVFSEMKNFLSSTVMQFLEKREENVNNLMSQVENKRDQIFGSIRRVLDGIEFEKEFDISVELPERILNFKHSFNKSLDYFVEELEACRNGIREFESGGDQNDYYDSARINQLYEKLNNLKKQSLENHLFDVNFLPRFAFPGLSVTIEDTQGTQMHGGRSRQIAISEFAPGCEITWKKKKYQSVGVDLSNPDREHFHICNHCEKFYSTQSLSGEQCPYCEKIIDAFPPFSSISPKKIIIKKSTKSVSEGGDYREAQINTFLPDPKSKPEEKSLSDLGPYSINIKKYGNIRLLLLVNGVYTDYADPDEPDYRESKRLEICNTCGKVDTARRAHYPLNQKFNRRKRCRPNWEALCLHHDFPTNVISIKITEKTESNESKIPSKSFLTTLKNAIIFAGQIICESVDGEIAGIVKDDELILYDNVDGGAGYVDIIFDRFEEVLKHANKNIDEEYETYQESCDHGCPRCLWSYRNKRDIKLIDKQLILPLLQECSNLVVPKNIVKKKLKDNKMPFLEKITSPALNIDVAKKIKDLFRSANKKIIIYSPYISTSQIEFVDDEGLKNWSDILGSVRTGEKSVSISLYLKKLEILDQNILRKLIEDGVDVHAIKSSVLDRMDSLDNTLVIIDPYEETTRKALEISGGLTEKLWREFSTLFLGKDDDFIQIVRKKIKDVSENSYKINFDDLTKLEKIKNYRIKRNDKTSLETAVSAFNGVLESANYEVVIFDPYMRDFYGNENLRFYLSYLCKYLKKKVAIKIITCGHSHIDIKNDKIFFSSQGYDVQILSYDEINHHNPIHRRFMIIDRTKSIHLDKGLRFLFDYNNYQNVLKETNIEIHSSKTVINDDLSTFSDHWNCEGSSLIELSNWVKCDTRKMK